MTQSDPSGTRAPDASNAEPRQNDAHRRWIVLGSVAVITVAAVGFFTGTRGAPEPLRSAPTSTGKTGPQPRDAGHPKETLVPLAPHYADIRLRPLGPNRFRHGVALAAMSRAHPPATAPVPAREETAIRAEAARRGRLRAYDGAPPRIPHPIAPAGPLDCAGCHLLGMRIAEHTAPPMSHALYASCTQCHVPEEGHPSGNGLEGGPPLTNHFEGAGTPIGGPRAWPQAPPMMPHAAFMRERCNSCHGVYGEGIRTTHPWRQSCQQCHAPSAKLNQQPGGTAEIAKGPPSEAVQETSP